MGDLSPRFNRYEFDCPCGCGLDTVDYELLMCLEALAVDLEAEEFRPSVDVRIIMHINSGCRCKEHNKAVGGSKNSQHLICRAADFWAEVQFNGNRDTRRKISDDHIADLLEEKYPTSKGIGRYVGRTHFDTRSSRAARWDKR